MSLMLALHIVFLVLWSAALLYFPQLMIRQVSTDSPDTWRDVMHMQHTLYALIMTPAGLLTVLAGSWLVFERGFSGGWLPVKLALVMLMVFFNAYCGRLMEDFRRQRVRRSLGYYRLLPLVPAVLIVAVVTLVLRKPF